ncbi:hypothetical protein VTN96DRAFT_10040 [Rasamsonia emersonii]
MSRDYYTSGRSNDEQLLPPVEDLPFDTFDRELLAQLGEDQGFDGLQSLSAVDNHLSATDGLNAFLTPAKNLNSRFLEDSREPSSSDSGFQSSPLNRFGPHTRAEISSATSSFAKNSRHFLSTADVESVQLMSERTGDKDNRIAAVSPRLPRQISLSHAPPVVQGIPLISTHELPDRFRSLFSFPVFNVIQSKCFQHVYQNDYNVVISAPTGSGKTVVMELAICRLVNNLKDGLFKVVYQAPTRSLCTERFRDWTAKLTSLGLQCAELTGDTDYSQLRSIQSASIIITTPEKWDSMTRKWRDHARLMQLVKLFLIDEVHVLNEGRGAVLEAVVSRMKSVGSNVRFIALSATIPNSEDIATWLGKDATLQHLPAHRELFGEEFRPVKLQKFVYGYQSNGNNFAFDRVCGTKLPEIIAKHSNRKPIMIFCCTRNSAIATSKDLANLWSGTIPQKRLWRVGNKQLVVKNPDLRMVISCGVAFHHAGLDSEDRHAVEIGFLEGQISIICSTSTLAVGVNLPCHLVIVKNTVCWQDGGCKEYSDLEMMQMLGRAGRPQFDDSAVAVILTRKERVHHYEKLVSGSEQLESCLHLNLIDHLNAEIGLGTVTDIETAVRWLGGTFLFVRLRRNPTHYKLRENADGKDEDEMLRQICEKDVTLLQDCGLVSSEGKLKSTPFGDAMARYYVKFETMRIFLSLPPKAKISEILSAIAQAEEFHEVRLKAGEKSLYKEINRANGIRFPIKVDVALTAHKISLLIQSELGAVEFPPNEQFQKHKLPFQQDKTLVFSHINRLIRCIIDCQIHLEDGISVRNALELARSFAARVWDNSPLQMKQIEQIGIVAVRKLAGAGITSIAALEDTEAHRIDMILSKNPPFGMKVLARLAEFPKLCVTIKMIGKETKSGKSVKVNFRAEVGFMNEKLPVFFQRRPVYVCFLAETSDGHLIDFRRMSANKLQKGHEILLSAELTSAFQHIMCYVMCDDIAGTVQYAELKPKIPESYFPKGLAENASKSTEKPAMNTSRRRSNDTAKTTGRSKKEDEIFDDEDVRDEDLIAAADSVDWLVIDDETACTRSDKSSKQRKLGENTFLKKEKAESADDQEQPVLLSNGKWACNHKCKDKTACKHFCCREGLDKPPKANKKQALPVKGNQLTLSASLRKKEATTCDPETDEQHATEENIELLDLTQPESRFFPSYMGRNKSGAKHKTTTSDSAELRAFGNARTDLAISHQTSMKHSKLLSPEIQDESLPSGEKPYSSDYSDNCLEDLPSPSHFFAKSIHPSRNFPGEEDSRKTSQKAVSPVLNENPDDNHNTRLSSSPDHSNDNQKSSAERNAGPGKICATEKTSCESSSIEPIDSSWKFEDQTALGFSLESSNNATAVDPPKQEDPRPPKRQAEVLNKSGDGSENSRKRTRYDNFCAGHNEPAEVLVLGQKTTERPPCGDRQNENTATEDPSPWEGIDPLLLEEFKDIVNFF